MANAVLSGHSLDDAWGEWTTHRRDIMEANYKLWPAAQVCIRSFEYKPDFALYLVTIRKIRPQNRHPVSLNWLRKLKKHSPFVFVQLLNFSLVPSAHRVLFVNLVSIGWNTFLAWKSHRTPRDSPALVPSVPQSQSVNDNSNNNQNPQKTAQQLQCIVCKASTKDP